MSSGGLLHVYSMSHSAKADRQEDLFRNYVSQFTYVGGISIAIGLLMFAPMLYMFEVYGRVLNSRSMQTLFALLVLLIVCLCVMECLDWVRFRVLRSIGLLIDRQYRRMAFQIYFDHSSKAGRFEKENPVSDLKLVRDIVTNPGFTALFDLPSAVAFLIFLYILNAWLLVLAGIALVVQIVLGLSNAVLGKEDKTRAFQFRSKAESQLSRTVANRVSALAMQMDKTVLHRWQHIKQQENLSNVRVQNFSLALQSLTKLLQLLTSSALLGLAAWCVIQNELTGGAGMLIVASTLGARLLMPAASVIGNWQSLTMAAQAMFRLRTYLLSQHETTPALTLPSPSGNIRFESVDAHPSIDAKKSLLRNLDFELTPGTVLAVVGPTGSGKSSLLKAAIGLWPCQKGAVRLDGADIFQWNKTHLGPFIGYLPQEIDLFEGTVASNLARFGDQDASMLHELSEALAMEFVETGLKGMQGLLQDEGANLSAGQRQKLGLARAFYGRPVLIALDEPSSRLDESSERRLMSLIRQRSQAGATIIFTTHRMSMLDVADKVLLLSNGSPQWLGARDEFVARLGKP